MSAYVDDETRDRLFSAFASFARLQRIRPRSVPHLTGCRRFSVEFGSVDMPSNDGLRFGEIATLNELRRVAGSQATVQSRLHVATCRECGEHLAVPSAMVSVDHEGRPLTREYHL